MEPILGIQAPCMVPSTYTLVVNGGVCVGLVCRRSRAEFDQPAPRDWPGHLCHGHFSGAMGLVRTQSGEQTDKASCSLKVGGK